MSDSTHVKMRHCWKSHAQAHIMMIEANKMLYYNIILQRGRGSVPIF